MAIALICSRVKNRRFGAVWAASASWLIAVSGRNLELPV
jgi:hypothetical protein